MKEDEQEKREDDQEAIEIRRTRIPQEGEVFGIVEQRLGGSRLRVRCFDNKTRICRIPGSLKRYLWVREGDLVLVKPWENMKDERGDVIFKYTATQISYLRRRGILQNYEEFGEL
ncbi:MAG: translation initiation factor eIF-1A [Candidatus Woesearchaeota archaeon]